MNRRRALVLLLLPFAAGCASGERPPRETDPHAEAREADFIRPPDFDREVPPVHPGSPR